MAKEASPSFAFITDYLRANKKAPFAEVRDAAAKKGHAIYPVSYGKAQAMLGIVKMSKRGEGKAARATKAKAAARGGAAGENGTPRRGPGRPRKVEAGAAGGAGAGGPRRGPGRPRKNAATAPSGNGRRRGARAFGRAAGTGNGTTAALDSIAAEIRALAQERDQLRRTLEKLRELVGAAV